VTITAIMSRINRALINEFPSEAIVHRFERISDGAGGWVLGDETVLDSQIVRKVGSARVGDATERTLPDGRIVILEKTIVFNLDGNVQEGDVIHIDGDVWEVATVSGRYALDATVFRHGG
jgi:hypothetical protein